MSSLKSCKIAPFHQIVAISQGTINTKFKWDWHYITNASNFSITVPAGSTDPDYSVNAVLNPPTVSLCAQNDPSQLVFSLNFKSGTFMYWTGHHTPVQNKVDMTGWIIAFVVNMGSKSIQQLPEEAQSKVLVPGQYGINQLLVDFTTAQLDQYMANLSNTPNLVSLPSMFQRIQVKKNRPLTAYPP
jgi:Icc-related predicted phosphoesterase